MALTNEIKTRILLRYDSLTNWTATDPVLKTGEIALVTTGPAKDTGAVTPDSGKQHPLLMKVGDGTHKFSELTWSSALAADVYAWAKQASLPVAKEGSGNVVTGIAWDEASKGLKFTTANMATSDAFTALETRVKTIEDTYATDAELAAAVQTINAAIALKADKSYVDDELAKKVNNSAFTEFQTANTNAINSAASKALEDANKYTDGREAAIKTAYEAYADQAEADAKAHAESKANAAQSAAAEDATAKANAAESAAKGHADSIVGTLKTDIENGTVIAGNAAKLGNVAADNYALKTYADSKASEAESAAKSHAETKATAAQNAAKSYTDTRETAITKAYGDAIAQAKKEILTGDSTTELKEAYDTLVEIQTWIEGAGVNATELTEAIAAEAEIRKNADDALQSNINTVSGNLAKIVNGETKAGDALLLEGHNAAYFATSDALAKVINGTTTVAKASDADKLDGHDSTYFATAESVTALTTTVNDLTSDIKDGTVIAKVASSLDDAGVAQVKGIKVDNAGHADSADNATKLGNKEASYYASVDSVTALGTTLNGNIATAKSEAISSANSTTDEKLKDYYKKSETYSKSEVYAKGETYSKEEVNSAINAVAITTTEGAGLKVTNNKHIDIDRSLTFIFNCGGASVEEA